MAKARSAKQLANDARMRKGGKKAGGKKGKKSSMLKKAGLYPFVGTKAAETFAGINALMSVLTGRDISNGWNPPAVSGSAEDLVKQARAGERFDVITYMREAMLQDSETKRARILFALTQLIPNQAVGSVTSVKGATRTFGPIVAAKAAKVIVRETKINNSIPTVVRQYARF